MADDDDLYGGYTATSSFKVGPRRCVVCCVRVKPRVPRPIQLFPCAAATPLHACLFGLLDKTHSCCVCVFCAASRTLRGRLPATKMSSTSAHLPPRLPPARGCARNLWPGPRR